MDSTILVDEHHSHINSWFSSVGNSPNMILIFRASRDGWEAKDFHLKCDNQGPTLTVIKTTEGYIFGGYIDQSFKSSNKYMSSRKSFLFTLNCYSKLEPSIFPIKSECYDFA